MDALGCSRVRFGYRMVHNSRVIANVRFGWKADVSVPHDEPLECACLLHVPTGIGSVAVRANVTRLKYNRERQEERDEE